MGTRNLTMVIDRQGEMKVAQYGRWDGYPEGQGATILEFAKDKEKMQKLKSVLNKIKFYNECDDIKDFLTEYENRWNNKTQTPKDEYFFNTFDTRSLGGKILDSLINYNNEKLPKCFNGNIYLYNDIKFAQDSLFCEWAYCINLQTNKLQCFNGFNYNKELEYPLFKASEPRKSCDGSHTYYGIKLLKEYDIDKLPDEETFIEGLNGLISEDEQGETK